MHDLALSRGPLVYNELAGAAELLPFASQLSTLEVRSLLALPLSDGNDSLGVLLFINNAPRNWPPNDVVVFKMIAEQAEVLPVCRLEDKPHAGSDPFAADRVTFAPQMTRHLA